MCKTCEHWLKLAAVHNHSNYLGQTVPVAVISVPEWNVWEISEFFALNFFSIGLPSIKVKAIFKVRACKSWLLDKKYYDAKNIFFCQFDEVTNVQARKGSQ